MVKKVLIVIASIFIVIIGLFAFFVIRDLRIESKLEKEWSKLGYQDKIDMKIYSKGDYAKVEQQIKLNFKTLYDKSNELLSLFEDPTYLQLLTNSNYQKDGPNFEQSFKFLESTNVKAADLIKDIKFLQTDDYLQSQKNKIKADDYYKDYYVDVIKNKTIYFESINDIIKGYEDLTKNTANIINILLFLREYKDEWYIEDNVFTYTNQSFYEKYLSLFDNIDTNNDKDDSSLSDI